MTTKVNGKPFGGGDRRRGVKASAETLLQKSIYNRQRRFFEGTELH